MSSDVGGPCGVTKMGLALNCSVRKECQTFNLWWGVQSAMWRDKLSVLWRGLIWC